MKKGSKHSDETKKKIGLSSSKRRHTEETKAKQRASHIGKKYKPMSAQGKENIRLSHLGFVPSESQKKKQSEVMKAKKIKRSEKIKQHLREIHLGKLNHQWKGGVTTENRSIRESSAFREWREAVFLRDNWTCQKTKIKGGILHPHHIRNFASYPKLRLEVSNGITLSEKSHRAFHKKYGVKNTTIKQLNEFLKTN